MSIRRALLSCAVLSLQDSCVFYPCCKGCFSRIHAEKEDARRFRCSKCGYWCHKDQVDHRYRLSLSVARDRSIFGVTVFGNSLNRFFGIHANGLQSLVENLDGPLDQPTRSTLLLKAVKDCFIGQHFLFGLKFTETGNEPWCQRPPSDGFNRGDRAQFVASQMLPPTPGGPAGCTVVTYYQVLLQNASEPQCCIPRKRLPATAPLLITEPDPSSSENAPFSLSGLLSQSRLRLEDQDSTLTFTPPWEQSLGLVTSSAEQEEPCGAPDNGHVTARRTDDGTEPHLAQRVYVENLKDEESFDRTSYFAPHPSFSVRDDFENSFNANTWSTPPQPDIRNCSLSQNEFFIEQQHTETCSLNSLVLEDCPFSESLDVFLCQESRDAIIGETGLDFKSNFPKQPEKTAQETKGYPGESSASQTRGKCSFLLNVTKVSTLKGVDFSDQVSEKCPNANKFKAIYSHECDDDDDADQEAHLSFEKDSYNCSADLFSGSFMSSVDTDAPAVTVGTAADACMLVCAMDQPPMSKKLINVTNLSPLNQKQRSGKSRNSFNTRVPEDFDFVPPSQSTPVMKVKVLPPLLHPLRKGPDECTKENITQSFSSSRQTPERRLRKKELYSFLLGQRRRTPNLDSRKAVWDEEDGIIVPTPAAKSQLNAMPRGRRFIEKGSSCFTLKRSQENRDDCKRTLLLTSPHSIVGQTGNSDEAVNEEAVDECHKNQMCDWSRDLFSDSI
uniref:Replication factor A C-terminal domain-containing protein n=1 Tax=Oryzias sinensis TaxID=183150 RepID=A0A8C8DGX7_9TELE